MEVEWDLAKASSNLEKHGVDFDFAIGIFENDRIEKISSQRDFGETRIVALGVTNGSVLIVVYTKRNGAIRIISARKAGRHDREKYRETFPG